MYSRLTTSVQFLRFIFHRFNNDRCLSHATNLSFATLLSIIPLMTVCIAILASFSVFKKIITQIQDFVFTHFTPKAESIQGIQDYFLTFSEKAAQLSSIGILFLVITSLLLMRTIDRALNEIWQVKVKRKPIHGFLVYWAVLTIGPLFIGISVALTSYIVSLPFFVESSVMAETNKWFLILGPFLATSIAFTLLYIAIPNRNVSFKHAFTGGILASLLFEIAKKGFAIYVTQFPTYRYIYGALSTIPIFIIWVYISWIVILLGAEMAHCLSVFSSKRSECDRSNETDLYLQLTVLQAIYQSQAKGRPMTEQALFDKFSGEHETRLISVLALLERALLINRADTTELIVIKDLHQYSLFQLIANNPGVIPLGANEVSIDKYPDEFAELLNRARLSLAEIMDVPIHNLFKKTE